MAIWSTKRVLVFAIPSPYLFIYNSIIKFFFLFIGFVGKPKILKKENIEENWNEIKSGENFFLT